MPALAPKSASSCLPPPKCFDGARLPLAGVKSLDYFVKMYTVSELCELARHYMAHTGMTASRLSILAAQHNRLFERLLEGYDCRATFAERASRWFDNHWPDDLPWPKTVKHQGLPLRSRPERAEVEADTAGAV